MRRIRAYTFNTSQTLPEIRARFEEVGPWRWTERESDRLGDYISSRVLMEPDEGMVKVFVEGELFIVNLDLEAEPMKLDAVYDTIFALLLPAIGATEIEETDPVE